MTTPKKTSVLVKSLIASATLALWAGAHAQEASDELAKPDRASIGAGIGVSSGSEKDRALFGQYNGLRQHGTNLLLDFDYVRRNESSGLWTTARGRNLGLDSRDLSFGMQKQGDWRFAIDYGELVKHDPRTVNSSIQGAGTTTPTISLLPTPGTGSELNFQLRRKTLGLGGDKWINEALQFEVSFKNEDKDGTRRWGRGFTCSSGAAPAPTCPAGVTQYALLMIPEPISWNMKQADAKLNFHTDKLFVSAGYYGSFFTNDNGAITPTVNGNLANFQGVSGASVAMGGAGLTPGLRGILQLPMSLSPDNQAHQLYVAGNYAFTPKVRSTFKLAYTHATQNENFGGVGFTGPAGRQDLGGVVNNTLAQFGITARPMPKLSLLANVRYEKRDDKTPIAAYNLEGAAVFNNSHVSNTKLGLKTEASYLLPANVRGTVGVDYDEVKRELPGLDTTVAGLSALRGKTQETTLRGDLRRSISENVTGSVGVAHANRTGSDWYNLCVPTATTAAPPNGCQGFTYGQIISNGAIFQRTGDFPFMLANRTRDKARGSIDWSPTDRASFTFVAEAAKDSYSPPSDVGLRYVKSDLLSVDGSYALSDKWKLTGYASLAHSDQSMGHGNGGYRANLKGRNTAFGAGIEGRPTGVWQTGARLTYTQDVNQYPLSVDPAPFNVAAATIANNTAQAAIGLPDVVFRETRLNLYANYTVDKRSDIRLNLIHVQTKLDEFTWGQSGVPFTYSDNTIITMNPNQRVTFVGATYIYKF
ncbi:MAG TPA: MtrB/PioB family decaheme-associated outer membrane protein [Burkholderiales bacterium]